MPVHKTKGSNASPLLNLGLGTLVPDWDSGEYSIDDQAFLESIDAKLSTDFCFRVYQVEPEINNVRVVKCYHKLVVVKETESQCSGCYVVFFIPTNDFSRSHHYDVSEEFLNSGALGSYSGLKIWTTLNGDVVRVNKYENGEKVFGVNLLESSDVPEFLAKVRAIQELCVNLTFQRGEKLTKNHDSQSEGEVSGGYNYSNYEFPPVQLLNGIVHYWIDGSYLYVDVDGDYIAEYIFGEIDAAICIGYVKTGQNSATDPDHDSNMDNWNNTNRDGNEPGYKDNPSSENENDGHETEDSAYIDPSGYSYLGWKDGNCAAVAKDLVRQSGVAPDGTRHQLLRENGQSSNYLVHNETSSSFINYAKNELRNRHLVMVGLDHTPNRNINEGTTDHFVVLNGYYYENGYIVFQYIECGRTIDRFMYSYGSFNGRSYIFLYDVNNDMFTGTHWKSIENGESYSNYYTITQYRENK